MVCLIHENAYIRWMQLRTMRPCRIGMKLMTVGTLLVITLILIGVSAAEEKKTPSQEDFLDEEDKITFSTERQYVFI